MCRPPPPPSQLLEELLSAVPDPDCSDLLDAPPPPVDFDSFRLSDDHDDLDLPPPPENEPDNFDDPDHVGELFNRRQSNRCPGFVGTHASSTTHVDDSC